MTDGDVDVLFQLGKITGSLHGIERTLKDMKRRIDSMDAKLELVYASEKVNTEKINSHLEEHKAKSKTRYAITAVIVSGISAIVSAIVSWYNSR